MRGNNGAWKLFRFPELRNITVRMIQGDNDQLIQEYKLSSAFDVEGLTRQCNRFHRRMKKAILEQQNHEVERASHQKSRYES